MKALKVLALVVALVTLVRGQDPAPVKPASPEKKPVPAETKPAAETKAPSTVDGASPEKSTPQEAPAVKPKAGGASEVQDGGTQAAGGIKTGTPVAKDQAAKDKPVKDPPTPEAVKAKVVAMKAALAEVMALGKPAERAMVRARRAQKVKAAGPIMKFLTKELAKIDAKAPEGGDEVINAKVNAFSDKLQELVACGEAALGIVGSDVGGAQGIDKDVLGRVHDQLYVQVAVQEINSYVEGNRFSGTFDGMFEVTQKHGRRGADAMVAVFSDIDQPIPVRQLAGEGVSQLGTKEDLAKVKEIYGDDLEDNQIRDKAKEMIARLGDRTIFDKEVGQVEDQLKEATEKQAKAEEKFKEVEAKVRELNAVQNRTPEQEEQLKALQKDHQAAGNGWVSAMSAVGAIRNEQARMYQGIRENGKTEDYYKKALEVFNRVAPYLNRDRLKSTMSNNFYNLACVQSLQGKLDDAMKSMEHAYRWGYTDFKWAMTDGDLRAIRKDERFTSLLDEVKSGKAKERWKKEAEEAKKTAEGDKPADPNKPSGDAEKKPSGDAEKKPSGDAEKKPAGDAGTKPSGETPPKPAGAETPKPSGDAA